jgi:hypothetical protein
MEKLMDVYVVLIKTSAWIVMGALTILSTYFFFNNKRTIHPMACLLMAFVHLVAAIIFDNNEIFFVIWLMIMVLIAGVSNFHPTVNIRKFKIP